MESEPRRRLAVAGVLLAAGLGRRMGGSKLLLPWRGKPLVRHVTEIALAAELDALYVVTGHQAAEVTATLEDLPVRIVANPDYLLGQSTSLRAGIAAVAPNIGGALIMLADQPLLTSDVVRRMVEDFRATGAAVVAACAGGRRGNPVLFARDLFAELMATSGDQGAREVIQAHHAELRCVEVDPTIFADVDTPEAYAALQASAD